MHIICADQWKIQALVAALHIYFLIVTEDFSHLSLPYL